MKVITMNENETRQCEAQMLVRHEAFGKTPQRCQNTATAWVETAWVAAKRTASLNGSAITRFAKRNAACDAHATAAVARVELLTR